MIIPKQLQFIARMFVAIPCGILLGAVLHERKGLWALPCGLAGFLLAALVLGILLSLADNWLRRVTRDPLWIQEHEDRQE